MKKICFSILVLILFSIGICNVEAQELDEESSLALYEVQDILHINNVFDIYLDDLLKDNIDIDIEVQKEESKEDKYSNLRNSIVSFALNYVGNPYVRGGNSLIYGTDCSGFVKLVYGNFGIYLPRTSFTQSQYGYGVSIEDIKEGDIISYGYNGQVSHSALYIGNNKIIHASTPELGIRIDSMYIMPIITIRRII